MQPQRSHISLSFTDESGGGHTVQLALKCRDCEGTGMTYSPAWKEWSNRVWALEDEGVTFTDAVERCAPKPAEPDELQCVECEGAGMVPTPQGRAVLDLVYTFQTGELFRKSRRS